MTVLSKAFLTLGLSFALIWSQSVSAQTTSHSEIEQTAELLATFLNAGRVIVERNQPLINDPRKGDKGFTPQVFERLVLDEFRQQTRIDLKHPPASLLSPTKDLLSMLLIASKEVVADAQLVINQRGIAYKNFIPASFGSQAARKFSKQSKVTIKQTALEPRNLKNTPDAYEEAVLKRLANQSASTTPIVEWANSGRLLRTMMPILFFGGLPHLPRESQRDPGHFRLSERGRSSRRTGRGHQYSDPLGPSVADSPCSTEESDGVICYR